MNTIRPLLASILILLAVAAAGSAVAAEYEIDPAHSTVGFQVRHMAISKTKGVFGDYAGTFSFEPGQPKSWSCDATIQAASVNTGNEKRDDHLRSEDFFNVAEFPTLTFKSTGIKMDDEFEGTLKGDLTIHGVTKAVEMEFEFLGTVTDPWGNDRAGFSASLKINRQDFGLSYNSVLEAGGLVVGDDVKIVLEIEGIKAK